MIARFCRLILIFALLVQAGLAHAQEREDQILLRDLQDILSHYVTANGGLENLQRILSVRVSGTIFTTGMDQPAEIILFRKRPEFKRVSMRMPDRSLEIGFDGTTVWRTIRTNFGRQVNVVDGDEAVYFTEDAAFDSPLMLAYTNSPLVTGVRLIGTERIDRVTCYVIEMLYGQNIRRVFLDARNWREIRIDSLDPESRELRSRTTLGDYFQHEGVWYARSALQVRADGHETEIRLERIDTNVGMFDSFFSPPAELR